VSEKCSRDRQATDDNLLWRMCFAGWINKADKTDRHTHTHTHTEYVVLNAFPQQQ